MSGGDAGLAALLRYIDGVRERALAGIRDKAAADAQALMRAARTRAGEQVRQALGEVRQDAEARIGLARAQSQARVRQARQALTSAALLRTWAAIEGALAERWGKGAARKAWVGHALEQAQRHLPGGTWRLSHPAAWKPDECFMLFEALRASRPDVALSFESADLAAGVRVTCGQAQLDMTAAGLLRDRPRIEGLWLAQLERAVASAPQRRTGT